MSKDTLIKHQSTDQKKSLHIVDQQNSRCSTTVIPGKADLPASYGKTAITVMTRDPYCIYCYWEISPQALKDKKKKLPSGETVLRIFDVTGIVFNGTNAHHFFDIPIKSMLGSRYITMPEPHKTICIELGFKNNKTYTGLARSRPISTPRAAVSETIDADWKPSDEALTKIYSLSNDYGTGLTSSLESTARESNPDRDRQIKQNHQ